jgi:hypothetical protein
MRLSGTRGADSVESILASNRRSHEPIWSNHWLQPDESERTDHEPDGSVIEALLSKLWWVVQHNERHRRVEQFELDLNVAYDEHQFVPVDRDAEYFPVVVAELVIEPDGHDRFDQHDRKRIDIDAHLANGNHVVGARRGLADQQRRRDRYELDPRVGPGIGHGWQLTDDDDESIHEPIDYRRHTVEAVLASIT